MANVIEITSFSAPELDVYARLTEAQLLNRFEPEKGLFIAESPKVIHRALDAGCIPVSLLMERKHIEGQAADVIARCGDIPVFTSEPEELPRIVKEKRVLRQLIAACSEISEPAYSEQESVTGILDHAEHLIFQIAQGRDTKNFRHVRDVLRDVFGHLNDLNTNKEATQGTPTGFSGLDRVLAGMG